MSNKKFGRARCPYLLLKAREMGKAGVKNIWMQLMYLNKFYCKPPLKMDQLNTVYHMYLYDWKPYTRLKERQKQ